MGHIFSFFVVGGGDDILQVFFKHDIIVTD